MMESSLFETLNPARDIRASVLSELVAGHA
jgi:hypothetical protein